MPACRRRGISGSPGVPSSSWGTGMAQTRGTTFKICGPRRGLLPVRAARRILCTTNLSSLPLFPPLSQLCGDQCNCEAGVGLWTDTRQWVLVLSVNWGDPVHHEAVLQQEEGGGGWTCDWFAPRRASLLWSTTGRLRRLDCWLRVAFLEELWKKYGEPEGEGAWIAAKLLPRRLPGSVRAVSPTHLQFFGFL